MPSSEDVKVTITAEDKASGVFAKVKDNLGDVGSAVAKVGKYALAGATAVAGLAVAFGVASFKEFIESEQQAIIANQALENALRNMTQAQLESATGFIDSAGALKEVQHEMKQAGEAALKLGFDDDIARLAFAKLFQVTGSLTQAQEDLALAQDLAAFSGRDLESAARAVTLVHAGGTRVLKEFGIEIEEGATAMDALAIVNDRVAGSAQKMAESTGGQLRILQERWANLKETVGATLVEAIQPFIKELIAWAESPDAQQKIQEIVSALSQFAKQMAPILVDILPKFISLIANAAMILGEWWSWWIKLGEGIGGVIFKVTEFINKVREMIEALSEAIQKMKDFIAQQAKGALQSFSSISGSILSAPGKLLGFQGGGVVPGPIGIPIPAIVHGGETVIPAGGGFGGINIYISGNSFLDEDAPNKMAEKILDVLKMNLRI